MGSPHRAFTLIELLVVISIIAILASLLLPAIKMVRVSAQASRCASAQRQVGMAVQAYGMDWEGMLPRLKTPRLDNTSVPVHWFDAIAPFLDLPDDQTTSSFNARWATVIWGCPSWPKTVANWLMFRPGYGFNWYPLAPVSYRTNFCWLDPVGAFNNFGVDINAAQITERTKRIMIGETTDWPLTVNTLPVTAYPSGWAPSRHNSRSNYLFFDGHVQSIAMASNAYLGAVSPSVAGWDP
jgi:prepilin-type N-terminal cleavage/methylation domain-containing protein/prepilin-type processing-associated H-X9-DG protein